MKKLNVICVDAQMCMAKLKLSTTAKTHELSHYVNESAHIPI